MLHVDAIQTATPGRVTAEGGARRVSSSSPSAALLRSRFQAVLYYREASGGGGEGEALKVAAWIKESLSAALPEHPVLAGRLRRDEQGGGWAVKLNDSGVRLVQATAEMKMAEFVEAKDACEKELRSAYWEEDGDPEHSSLFCVQVTKFNGGGYSVGISCSLLLADPLFLSNFVRSWARTHAQMLSQGLLTRSPIFHLTYFRRTAGSRPIKSVELDSNPIGSPWIPSITVLFRVGRDLGSQYSYSSIAMACLQESARRVGARCTSNFTLITSHHEGDAHVESCADLAADESLSKHIADVVWWDQLGMENITFIGDNKPFHISHKIESGVGGLLVVVMVPEAPEDLLISVTIPKN